MVQSHLSERIYSLPPDSQARSRARWLWEETRYHLLPWGPGFLHQKTAFVAASAGLAITVTVAWLLAATGGLAPAAVIAWWSGWSVYEVICRLHCKPWIKEGLWWRSNYKRAGVPDMIAYVATKNLLIGAGLFLVLYLLAVLPAAAG